MKVITLQPSNPIVRAYKLSLSVPYFTAVSTLFYRLSVACFIAVSNLFYHCQSLVLSPSVPARRASLISFANAACRRSLITVVILVYLYRTMRNRETCLVLRSRYGFPVSWFFFVLENITECLTPYNVCSKVTATQSVYLRSKITGVHGICLRSKVIPCKVSACTLRSQPCYALTYSPRSRRDAMTYDGLCDAAQ